MIWNILIDLNNIDLGPLKEIYSHSTFSSTFNKLLHAPAKISQEKTIKGRPSVCLYEQQLKSFSEML